MFPSALKREKHETTNLNSIHPNLLHLFFSQDDIKRLLLHHNEAIRDSAFTLAMRHCRHFPR